jgi:hypothetical protein
MTENLPKQEALCKHWSEETNWQRLGDIVASLKDRVDDAIARRVNRAHSENIGCPV